MHVKDTLLTKLDAGSQQRACFLGIQQIIMLLSCLLYQNENMTKQVQKEIFKISSNT
jgi:hypothetical protein